MRTKLEDFLRPVGVPLDEETEALRQSLEEWEREQREAHEAKQREQLAELEAFTARAEIMDDLRKILTALGWAGLGFALRLAVDQAYWRGHCDGARLFFPGRSACPDTEMESEEDELEADPVLRLQSVWVPTTRTVQ